jgi:hypothetical protein
VAAVRQVFNPLEKDDVIGITNYLDIGLQLAVPLVDTGAPATAAGLQLGGSWQVGVLLPFCVYYSPGSGVVAHVGRCPML